MSKQPPSLSHALAAWSSTLCYDAIPSDVLHVAKSQMLDALGVRIAAQRGDAGQAIKRVLAKRFSCNAASTSSTLGASPFDALFGGVLTASLDFDDTHDETLIHPSGAIVPALFSAARSQATSGVDLLTALVAGYEVCCRIGVAASGLFHKNGFHPTGIIGSVGAAAAVAKVWKYDALMTEHSLGLAASVGGGLLQAIVDGTDARYVNSGSAALNGFMACSLAGEGLTGAGNQLDGKFGLLRAHVQNQDELRFERSTDMLGAKWEMRGISCKPYPTGYVTHEFIDALLEIVEGRSLQPSDIARIECTVNEAAARLVFIPLEQKIAPDRAPAARVAMPHVLAEAIVFGEIGADSFSPARMNDARVKSIAAKVDYRLGQSIADNQLAITLHDGESIVRATARKAMTDINIYDKFIANAKPGLGVERSQIIADGLLNIEQFEDISVLFDWGV